MLQILIAEDNRGDVILVREALTAADLRFKLHHVSDGEQALNYVRRTGAFESAGRPELVLLDLNLPRVEGWEVLEEIRGTPELQHIPVVILSSSSAPSDISRASRYKRTIYIQKPPSFDEFMGVGKQIGQFIASTQS